MRNVELYGVGGSRYRRDNRRSFAPKPMAYSSDGDSLTGLLFQKTVGQLVLCDMETMGTQKRQLCLRIDGDQGSRFKPELSLDSLASLGGPEIR